MKKLFRFWGKNKMDKPMEKPGEEKNQPIKEVKFALEEQWKQEPPEEPVMEQTENSAAIENPLLLEELEKVKQQRDEYLDHLQRMKAEFENFRKRVNKERLEMSEYLLQAFMTRMIDILDHLERALHPSNQTDDFHAYRTGVEMVWKQLHTLLQEYGLQRIETAGQPFDPRFHEAVSQLETDQCEPNRITAEFAPGYCLKDRVLRAPKVQVAVRPKTPETME